MDKEISPPPTKKRRLIQQQAPDLFYQSPQSPINSSQNLSIYSWNINGITPFIQRPITSFFTPKSPAQSTTQTPLKPHSSASSLRDFLRRTNWPQILCLQEVKINPTDSATIRAVEHSVRSPRRSTNKDTGQDKDQDEEPDYRAFFCLPSDKHNARGFGGRIYGVCTLIRTSFLALTRARTVDWDLEGRVLITETEAMHTSASSSSPSTYIPKLAVVNLYCVNGTENAYKDPKTGQVSGTRHGRKRAFHALLLDECKTLEAQGYAVVLAGDMNVARSAVDGFPNLRTYPEEHVRNRADFNKKFFSSSDDDDVDDDDKKKKEGGLKGIDTFRRVHGEEKRGYTYYPRGRPWGESCDRVDLVICSRSLEGNIADAGILETAKDRGPSDHCPLFATCNFGEEVVEKDRGEGKKRKIGFEGDE